MKKKYLSPEIDVEKFTIIDNIFTLSTGEGGGMEPGNGGEIEF